jgi:hypothetical protein
VADLMNEVVAVTLTSTSVAPRRGTLISWMSARLNDPMDEINKEPVP